MPLATRAQPGDEAGPVFSKLCGELLQKFSRRFSAMSSRDPFELGGERGVVFEPVQAFERADDPWSERHIDQATTMRVVNLRATLLRHFVERLVRKAKQRRLKAQRRAVIGHAAPHLAAGESHYELENRRCLTGLGLVGRSRLVHHEEG